MAECGKMATCTFIQTQLSAMPAVVEMLKRRYCLGECTECVRYQLEQKGIVVPIDVFPDDEDAARRLLRRVS
jgi:hypothetical protein